MQVTGRLVDVPRQYHPETILEKELERLTKRQALRLTALVPTNQDHRGSMQIAEFTPFLDGVFMVGFHGHFGSPSGCVEELSHRVISATSVLLCTPLRGFHT